MTLSAEGGLPRPPYAVGLGWTLSDSLMSIDHYPAENTKSTAQGSIEQTGGPVIRAMMTVAKLGMSAAVISAIGDDDNGRQILRELASSMVNTSELRLVNGSETRRSHAWLSRDSGSRTIVYLEEGPELSSLSTSAKAMIENSRLLHLDGRELEVSKLAARTAKSSGVLVSLDAGSPKPGLPELLGLADIAMIPLETLIEIAPGQTMDLRVRSLFSDLNLSSVIVTHGKQGSAGYARNGSKCFVPSFPIEVIDSNGAGDVYAGAIVWGTSMDLPMEQSMKYAAACAALKCSKLGNDGIPTLLEVNEMIRTHG
jgi:sulfofructose kinase